MPPLLEAAEAAPGAGPGVGKCEARGCLFSFFLGWVGGEEVESRFGGGGRGDQAEEARRERFASLP